MNGATTNLGLEIKVTNKNGPKKLLQVGVGQGEASARHIEIFYRFVWQGLIVPGGYNGYRLDQLAWPLTVVGADIGPGFYRFSGQDCTKSV